MRICNKTSGISKSRNILLNISASKVALRYNQIDQENLLIKVQQWKTESDDHFKYRPNKEGNENTESFLFCHQTKWQQQLLKKYGQAVFFRCYGNTACGVFKEGIQN